MATTLQSDVKVYDPRIQVGYRDRITQVIDVFNGASNGTVKLLSVGKSGQFDYKAFWARMSGIATRRDNTSTSAATAIKGTQSEIVSVKVDRKLGPGEVTLNALRKMGAGNNSDDAAMVAFGEYVADEALQERVNTALASGVAAIGNVSGLVHNQSAVSGSETMRNSALVAGLAKMGDRAANVSCWVMHSKPFFDLIQAQVADKVTGIADVVMFGGSPATLNRPVLVTDSASLIVSGTPDLYWTLGLTADGVVVEDTEEEIIVNQMVTGLEQLVSRFQGEYSYNLGVKGFTWDVANGGANPTLATLKTGSNWDQVYADVKALAGVAVKTQ